jgi:hypothetical protein
MAGLKKADLEKRGNDEILLKKFFDLPGHMNIFAVKRNSGNPKEGQFIPEAIVFKVDNDEIAAYERDQISDFREILARLQENIGLKGAANKVLLSGRWKNDSKVETISITDLDKTEEFGGQTGGKRVNLGIQFEKDFYKSLNCEVECLCEHTKYEDAAKDLVNKINNKYDIKGGLSKVEAVGGKNQPRPLKSGNGGIVVGAGKKDIGSTVTDITTIWGGKDEQYLSLKYGDTLTFINSGVGRIFTPSDYKNFFKNYQNPIGKAIFDMFAIDKVEYAKVFNNYGKGYKGKKVDVTREANITKIQSLLQYAIGYGYWMVHGKGSNVDCYEVDEAYMKRASQNSGSIVLHYGGSRGSGKRLDIHMESPVYRFMWNLRNKQGGKYPSHIMCDYKKK